MKEFIIKIIGLVLCLFIVLSVITQLLTLSNTVANMAGIILFIAVLWIGGEIFFKLINKASENED